MTVASRKTLRTNLTTAMKADAGITALVPADQIYGYQIKDFGGITPIIRLMSTSSDRLRLTHRGNNTSFMVTVQIWVLYSGTGWTESQAEDLIDDIEQAIAEFILAQSGNNDTYGWRGLSYSEPTQVLRVDLSGVFYLMEQITLSGEVYA